MKAFDLFLAEAFRGVVSGSLPYARKTVETVVDDPGSRGWAYTETEDEAKLRAATEWADRLMEISNARK